MKHFKQASRTHGMTLVEVVVAAALLALIFGGIMAGFASIMNIIGSSKAQSGALSLANEKMEYIRSLPYDSVGTIGGIPSGPIPQTGSSTLNGISYSYRVLVEYVDDPKDGVGAADSNGILADYKLVKVTYSWNQKGEEQSAYLISNIVPLGIETSTGGGTLVVNVFDAAVHPIADIPVHVYNNTGTSTVIDTIRYTNSSGVAMFAGAPARAGYQITVTDNGYSTDQTYSASSTNPNPVTPHVAVVKNQVSTMNFQIDQLSNLTIATQAVPVTNAFEDQFNDTTKMATTTRITTSGGVARLSGASGSYPTSGSVLSSTTTPGTFVSWDTLSIEGTTTPNTKLRVHVYGFSSTSTAQLIPDSVLPGNTVGFLPGNVSLSGLSPVTYPSLQLKGQLYSSSTSATPQLSLWKISYTTSKTPLANIPFSITGAKKIGTNGSNPVYKYQKSFTTNGSGLSALSNLEWDVYSISVTSGAYTIAEACKNIPYVLSPGVSQTEVLSLSAAVAHSLRVVVLGVNGIEIPNAQVNLTAGAFNLTKYTSTCGQAFFGSGVSATDYVLTVSAFGYVTQTINPETVVGNDTLVVTLVSS